VICGKTERAKTLQFAGIILCIRSFSMVQQSIRFKIKQKHSLQFRPLWPNREFIFFKMRNIKLLLCLVFDTFVENNWIILHLHHTRLFCEPINQVVLEIFWFLFIASRPTPIVLNNYFESNWLLYHWKWSDTQNYPCKLQGHSSFRFPIALSVFQQITNHSLQLKGNSPFCLWPSGSTSPWMLQHQGIQ
jgi:hypothetical protein